jgi:hypothetical protein
VGILASGGLLLLDAEMSNGEWAGKKGNPKIVPLAVVLCCTCSSHSISYLRQVINWSPAPRRGSD